MYNSNSLEHCCQLEELGDFDAFYDNVYYGLVDELENKRKDMYERLPEPKVTTEALADSIAEEIDSTRNYIATTSSEQENIEPALVRLGFVHVGSFPGIGMNEIKLWLKVKEGVRQLKGGKYVSRTRPRTQRQGTSARPRRAVALKRKRATA